MDRPAPGASLGSTPERLQPLPSRAPIGQVTTSTSLRAMEDIRAKSAAGLPFQALQGMIGRKQDASPDSLLKEITDPELPDAQRESAMRRLIADQGSWAKSLVLKVAKQDSPVFDSIPSNLRALAVAEVVKDPARLHDMDRIYVLARDPEIKSAAAHGLDAFSTFRKDARPDIDQAVNVSYEASKALHIGGLVKIHVQPEMNGFEVASALENVSDEMGERVFDAEQGVQDLWIGIRVPDESRLAEIELQDPGAPGAGAKVLEKVNRVVDAWREDLRLRPLEAKMVQPITAQISKLLNGEAEDYLESRDGLPPEVFEARRQSLIRFFEHVVIDLRGIRVNPVPLQLSQSNSANSR